MSVLNEDFVIVILLFKSFYVKLLMPAREYLLGKVDNLYESLYCWYVFFYGFYWSCFEPAVCL